MTDRKSNEDAILLRAQLAASECLCRMYFRIAADAIGEEAVREELGEMIRFFKSQQEWAAEQGEGDRQ